MVEPPILERLRATLSADERARADRFVFDEHRHRFIVARAMLRDVLGRYLQVQPADVRFYYGPHGRPELTGVPSSLRFNLSHSRDLALLAVADRIDVGIDVEAIRADFATLEIAARFFSRHEIAALQRLDAEGAQVDAFFSCWTRKEAYIKARGVGLSLGLDTFDVTLEPGAPAELLATRHDDDDAALWSMAAIAAGVGYAAAVCAAVTPLLLQGYDWQPPQS